MMIVVDRILFICSTDCSSLCHPKQRQPKSTDTARPWRRPVSTRCIPQDPTGLHTGKFTVSTCRHPTPKYVCNIKFFNWYAFNHKEALFADICQ